MLKIRSRAFDKVQLNNNNNNLSQLKTDSRILLDGLEHLVFVHKLESRQQQNGLA